MKNSATRAAAADLLQATFTLPLALTNACQRFERSILEFSRRNGMLLQAKRMVFRERGGTAGVSRRRRQRAGGEERNHITTSSGSEKTAAHRRTCCSRGRNKEGGERRGSCGRSTVRRGRDRWGILGDTGEGCSGRAVWCIIGSGRGRGGCQGTFPLERFRWEVGKERQATEFAGESFQEIERPWEARVYWSSERGMGETSAVQGRKIIGIYCSFLATLVAATLAAAVLVFLYVRW